MRSVSLCVFLAIAAVLALLHPCSGYVQLTLSNSDMSTFASGVAVGWTSFTTGNIPSQLQFFPDTRDYQSYPYSQGISGIDTLRAPGTTFSCGLTRQISVTPGDVYMFVGFQDLFDPNYLPPPGRRYAHFFGIGQYGETTAPTPFTMGTLKWMGVGQWYYNNVPGNSTQVGGMHRCIASWSAKSTSISIWTGLNAYGDGPIAASATAFEADDHSIFDFPDPTLSQLTNPGFETVLNLTSSLSSSDPLRITFPSSWVPAGGSIGEFDSYYTDSTAAHSGSAGLRIYNRRGCLTRGAMQRVSVPAQSYRSTFSVWVRSNLAAGTVARIGFDPLGGDDINASSVVWSTYTATGEAWQQVSVTAACSGSVATLFVAAMSQGDSTGGIYYADFDDCTLTFTQDTTPPTSFSVTASASTTLLHYLSATISPTPTDPESGIASLQYAVGTSPSAQDVQPYTDCTSSSSLQATGLNLTSGSTYYITVRATNGAGTATTAVSQGIACRPEAYAFSWSTAQHLSETAYNADNPRVAAYNGNLYAVWRESNDITWNGSSSQIVLRARIVQKVGNLWVQPTVLSTVANAWWPDVAASSAGTAVSYVTPGDASINSLHVQLSQPYGSFRDQVAASNVADFPRITYTSSGGFEVGCNAGTSSASPSLAAQFPSWAIKQIAGSGTAGSNSRVRVASNGSNIYCLWSQLDAGTPDLYFAWAGSNGVFSTPLLLAAGVSSGEIAVAPDGEVSVVYFLGNGTWYLHSASGVTFDAPQYLDSGTHASIAAGPDSRVHVIIFANTGLTNGNGVSLVFPEHMVEDATGWSAPQAATSASCTSGSWAEEPGEVVVDSSGIVHLVWANNPNDLGQSQGTFSGYYWIDYLTTGWIGNGLPASNSISGAKMWGNDAPAQQGKTSSKVVTLSGKQVTAVGTFEVGVVSGSSTVWQSVPCFYIEEADRSNAIRVVAGNAQSSTTASLSVAPGDIVSVSGVLSTINNERTVGYVSSAGVAGGVSYTKTGTVSRAVSPLFLNTKDVDGAASGPTPGISGGSGSNNVGLLIRVIGRVTSVSQDERGVKVLYMDDGDRFPLGHSVWCGVISPSSSATVGNFIAVTGVATFVVLNPGVPASTSYLRGLMPRDSSSVTVLGSF